jgi:formyl-CoA transferase
VRVLEVCQIMAGPFCGALLGDMGADVIKVEKPNGGDDARHIGRYFAGGEGHGFMNLNRNKRSIALDLKSEKGRALFLELAANTDALIENFRPGTMARLGFGYEDLKKVNPALIYASISGYGHTGPYSSKGGFDLVAQGLSSLMSFTGEPGRPPVKIPIPVCDLNAGLYTAFSILTAYIYRQRTGKGQKIDTALVDAGLGYTFWQASQFFPEGEVPVPRGSAHEMTAPYQAFECSDGYLVLGVANQPNWVRFCKGIDREDLMERNEYKTDKDRAGNYLALADELSEIFGKKPRDEWLALLEKAGVPAGPILDMQETFDHPQIQAREMAVEVDHPTAGRIKVLGIPPKLSETPGVVRRPSPLLGQHTDEILKEIGKSGEEIERLRSEGVLA